MGLSFALLTISVVVVAAVLFVSMPLIGAPGTRTLFFRYAGVSAICAVGSSAMYFMSLDGGAPVTLVLADTAMVLAPLLLYVALVVLEGRRALRPAVATFALAVLVATVTATSPPPTALGIKALVLALACGACAWVAARSPVESWRPLRLIAVVTALYALYSLARVTAEVFVGPESDLFRTAFSFAPATVVGSLAVLLIGIAVVRLRVDRRTRIARVGRPGAAVVVLGDWDLASAAFGADRVRSLLIDLRAAARDLDADAAAVPYGVEIAVPRAVAQLSDRLRSGYSWGADEIALLSDRAATGSVRTHPPRSRGWTRARSPRT